ncbi:ABC transporter substrate-binding protein [Paenibacillus eucommiae]|uniref:ABC-type glycerol-3-phosphate transport system substrate-binding protein n=1 Tax=Paenibacillus eucommiae TaxID=1355755 RepID=A0ABS4J0P4_9BACL|nr:ABC transporter substrate-binding protein [Paenibacillus eucommiae]MBP1993408.1 ABC-type glycerol-3-phosphate transport system substrate-binding protein [Paenibacillus eucommiae]
MLKKLAYVLLMTVLVASIAACSSSEKKNGSDTDNQTETPKVTEQAAGALDKKLDISWISVNFHTSVEGDWTQKQLEKQLNIKLKDVKVDINNAQQLDLMLASGEMPDAGWIGKDSLELYEQGLTRTIPRKLIEQYAPSYAKLLSKYSFGWNMNQMKDNPDEYRALTGMYEDDSIYFSSTYRLDWLENLGIKPNGKLEQLDDAGRIWVTDTPFTQAELTNILKRFTEDDPDQNSKKDTYGMSGNEFMVYSWSTIEGMFGFADGQNVEDNSKTVLYYASNQYKDFLKYVNSLYKSGYIDKEFVTLDWNKFHEKIAANKIGYFPNQYQYLNPLYIDRSPHKLLNNVPESKILYAPPEVGESGKGGTNRYYNPYRYSFVVKKDVSDEKLIRILQLMEYMYFDKEAQVWTLFGEEGVNWNWEGEPYKSSPISIENSPKVDNYNGNYISPKELQYLYHDELTAKLYKYAGGEWAEKYGIYPHRNDMFSETKLADLSKQYDSGLETMRKEFMYKAITGEVDIDKEWDNYLKKLDSAGLEKIHVELNKAPLVSELLKQ